MVLLAVIPKLHIPQGTGPASSQSWGPERRSRSVPVLGCPKAFCLLLLHVCQESIYCVSLSFSLFPSPFLFNHLGSLLIRGGALLPLRAYPV